MTHWLIISAALMLTAVIAWRRLIALERRITALEIARRLPR